MFLLSAINPLTVYTQSTSDSLKCFTYKQARKIITDLRKLPIKDSIIARYDSIMHVDSLVIENHEVTLKKQRAELINKGSKINKLKKKINF